MDLTIQIVTNNNEKTLEKVLQSVKPLNANILIGDKGSCDSTLSIAENYNAEILKFPYEYDQSEIRNKLTKQVDTSFILYLQPWEILLQGHSQFLNLKYPNYNISILQNNIISKELRVWKKDQNILFKNPVYEYLDSDTENEINAIIYSIGYPNYDECLLQIQKWMQDNPLAKEPYYYQAMTLLAQKKYEDFLKISEYYMFLDNLVSKSTLMNKYYFSLVQIMIKKNIKISYQHLNLCLCAKPLMAEFWCLQGDIYYLLQKYKQAIDYYEIAMILGSRRLNNDKWPMDISKYKEYPQNMIESCKSYLEYEVKTLSK